MNEIETKLQPLIERFNNIKDSYDSPSDEQFLSMLNVTLELVTEFEQAVESWSEALKAAHSQGFAEGVQEASALFTTGGQTRSPNRWDDRNSDSSDHLYVLG